MRQVGRAWRREGRALQCRRRACAEWLRGMEAKESRREGGRKEGAGTGPAGGLANAGVDDLALIARPPLALHRRGVMVLRGEAIVRVTRRRTLAVRELALLAVRGWAVIPGRWRWPLLLLLLLRCVALPRRRLPHAGVWRAGVPLRREWTARVRGSTLNRGAARLLLGWVVASRRRTARLAGRVTLQLLAGRRRAASREATRPIRRWPVARVVEDLTDLRKRIRAKDLARPRPAGARHAARRRAKDLPRLGRARAMRPLPDRRLR